MPFRSLNRRSHCSLTQAMATGVMRMLRTCSRLRAVCATMVSMLVWPDATASAMRTSAWDGV